MSKRSQLTMDNITFFDVDKYYYLAKLSPQTQMPRGRRADALFY